ncbi:MAG: ABC transporter permease [Ilumatobacteraceae bacterium]
MRTDPRVTIQPAVVATAPDGTMIGEVVGSVRPRVDVGIWLCAGWLISITLLAIVEPLLPLQDPLALSGAAREGPSSDHWLGTDQLSRDQLSRVLSGAQVSLTVGIVSALTAGVIGTLLGLVSGFYRRTTETVVMGLMDIMLAAPALIFVIVITSMLGAGIGNVILAISILSVPAFARVARAQTLVYSERDFVKAARSLGATRRRILFLEIAPNVLPTMLAYSLVTVSVAIIVEGSLSFLGLGVSPERATWGGMIANGRSHLNTAPHISLIPGAIMFVTVLALNALGDKLQRRHDDAIGFTA